MASTFFGLNIAYTGLLAANANVNTTGNNISNVETKGYSRQQTVQTAADALRISQSYGMAGAGVSTSGITQVRNEYYDLKYWNSQTNLGQYEIKQYYNLQIENNFMETDLTEGFGTIFSRMFTSLDEVHKSSGEGSVKNQFLADAGTFCEYFNAMSTSLTKLQQDANAEIKNKVDEINSIAEQIVTLNKQINTIEVTGSRANELRDKRNLLIDDLSKIVDVEVRETPIYLAGGSDEKSGVYNYEVSIAGGQILLDGYDYNRLLCVARTDKVNQSDAEGLYDIKWSFGKPGDDDETKGIDFNLYGRNLGGELKGLVEIRDGNNEEYFHGKMLIPPTGTGSDANPYKITLNVGDVDYLTDINKCTLPEDGSITIGGRIVHYSSFEYDGNGNYTFSLVKGSSNPNDLLGKEGSVGREIDYQGIPYYQEQMNEFVRIFARAMNDIEVTAQDANGNRAEDLFTAKDITDKNNTFTFGYDKDLATGEYIDYSKRNNGAFSSDGDTYYKLTASTFEVNHNMIKNPDKFGTTADVIQGKDAQDITEKLLMVQDDRQKVEFRACSAKEFLQCITSDVALNTNNSVTFTKNYTNINSMINNQRLSIMGVDNDEEALNLVKYQEAYNLAAKMMSVMQEIYDTLIRNTGV